MGIQLLENQLAGLEQRGKELRAQEQKFLKVQGLREQQEKATAELAKMGDDITGLQEEIKEQKTNRNKLMADICKNIITSMDAVLPSTGAVVDISEDGKFTMGWNIDGKIRPYKGLSGGEKVSFDCGLAHALGAGILMVEAAELDKKRLQKQIEAFNSFSGQVIISTCHAPEGTLPDGWAVITI